MTLTARTIGALPGSVVVVVPTGTVVVVVTGGLVVVVVVMVVVGATVVVVVVVVVVVGQVARRDHDTAGDVTTVPFVRVALATIE